MDLRRLETVVPILPHPMTNTVTSLIERPMRFLQLPACMSALDAGISWRMDSRALRVISATASVGPSGVLETFIPCLLAASTSTLSMPMPTLAIAFRSGQAENTSSSRVSRPARSPTAPWRCSMVSCLLIFRLYGFLETSYPASVRMRMASSELSENVDVPVATLIGAFLPGTCRGTGRGSRAAGGSASSPRGRRCRGGPRS